MITLPVQVVYAISMSCGRMELRDLGQI